MVLIAKVDVDLLDADRPGGDERALDEAVRIALEVPAVLEGAGLAFVDVDRKQPRRRFRGDRFPFASRGEARAAESAKAGILHHRDYLFALLRSVDAGLGELVAAFRAVRGVIDVRRIHDLHVRMTGRGMLHGLRFHQPCNFFDGRMRQGVLAHHGGRRTLATSDAGSVQHAHVLAENPGQFRQQLVRARDVARDRVAHAHRDRGRRGLTVLDHVEMVVESRDLVDFGHRELHLLGQGDQVRGREMPVAILDAVQVFDQQVAPQRRVFQEGAYFLAGFGIGPTPLGRAAHARAFCSRRRRRAAVVHQLILPPG